MFTRILLSVLLISITSCNEKKEVTPIVVSTNTNISCLVKSYSYYENAGKTGAEGKYFLGYNNDGKVISISIPSSVSKDTTKYTYQESKANLGSDSKPYIIEFTDGALSSKYFCDNNGRVNKVDYYDSSNDKYPSSIDFPEYDSNGNNIKTTSKYYNKITGDLSKDYQIYEAEYLDGNLRREYETYQFSNIQVKRHLSVEYTASLKPNKSKIMYLYNYGNNSFGNGDKYYPDKKLKYDNNGLLKTQGTFVYKFDNKDYLLSRDIKFPDGTSESYFDYSYQCK